MQFWALIVDSFRESLDRKIFWVMAAMSVLIAAAMFCIGFEPGKIVIFFGTWEFQTDLFTVDDAILSDRRQISLESKAILDRVLGELR